MNISLIQPVMPLALSENWQMIVRPVIPIAGFPFSGFDYEEGGAEFHYYPLTPEIAGPQYNLRMTLTPVIPAPQWAKSPIIK